MKHIFLSLIFSIFLFSFCFSQSEDIKKNSVYYEFLGIAGHYSFNYDRNIYFSNYSGLTVGAGFSPTFIDFDFSPRIPLHLNIFNQFKRHTIGCGIGFTPYLNLADNLEYIHVAIFGQIGYKYSILKDNYYIGLGFTPLFYDVGEFQFYPWGAVKFGYKF
jgi:hypothetical protein